MIALSSKYAIRTLIELSQSKSVGFISVVELARRVEIPRPYLAKVIKELVRSGLLHGKRGPGGGVKLSTHGMKASFYDVCSAMRDPVVDSRCFLSRSACDSKHVCPYHGQWSQVRQACLGYLKKSKISG